MSVKNFNDTPWSLWTKSTSDGFFRKDYGNRNKKQLVPAVVSFAKQGTETETTYEQLMGLVAPRGRRRPKFSLQKKKWDVVAHRKACCWNFESNFPGFHRLKKRVFSRRSVGDLTNLRSGSQTFDKCMCHVCHDVCGVCVEDWQGGHSEDKSNCRFKLTLYSFSFSSLSSAMSISNSNCSSATCG